MRLYVTKFRQWTSESFQFPDTGFIRLNGQSGAGKSSIMYAIAWALYGSAATKNVTTKGMKGTEVTLSIFDTTICRAKNPERLTVGELTEDAAQQHVCNVIGMSWEQFSASSFIQQGMQNSLLTLTPADQLRFVQRLAFGSDDPDQYRDRIYATMKSYEEKISRIEAVITSIQSQYHQLSDQITSIQADLVPGENQSDLEAQLVGVNQLLKAARAAEQSEQDALRVLNAELQNPNRRLESKIESMRASISADEKALQSAIAVDRAETLTQDALEQIKQKLGMCASQKVYLSRLAAIKASMAKLGMPESTEETLRSELATQTVYQEGVTKQREEMHSKLQRLKESMDVVSCPACQAPLRKAVDGSLIHAGVNPTSKTEVNDTADAVRELDAELKRIATRIREYQNLVQAMKELGEPPVAKIETLEMLQVVTSKFEASLSNHNNAVAANAAADAAIKTLRSRLLVSESQLAEAENTLATLSLAPVENIQSEIRSVTSLIQSYRQQQAKLTIQAEEFTTRLAHLRKQQDNALKAKALQEQLEKVNATLTAKEQERDALVEQHTAATRLKNLSDIAATEAVASILDSINTNAKLYLDMLFPDCGTSIALCNSKENKTDGKQKAQFSLSIVHRGIAYDSIGELSGGEQSRACLAFQLAISDLYNSQVLFLDEAFAGVHHELRNDCMEVLKEVSTRKLVLMAEHGCDSGLFDDVIDVK